MPSVAREPAEPRFVVMLVYPGVVAMDIFGPLEAFAMANATARRPLYRLAIAGMSLAPVDTSLGIRITPSVAVADIKQPIDTLLVSGGYDTTLRIWNLGQPVAPAVAKSPNDKLR